MTQWQGLEPEGAGHDLLRSWAPWVREEPEGAASWSVRARLDKVHDGEPPEYVMIVDRIVSRIKLEHRAYWDVISHVYLGEKSYWQAALDLHRTEGWIRTMVLASCGLVEQRYDELAPVRAVR